MPDWNELYWRIQSYRLKDTRFDCDNFEYQPEWLVSECIAFYEKSYREQVNVDAMVHAQGWSGLFNGFAGKGDRKMSHLDLLPFKMADENKQLNTLSESTKRCIRRLMVSNRLPYAVFKALAYSGELKKIES